MLLASCPQLILSDFLGIKNFQEKVWRSALRKIIKFSGGPCHLSTISLKNFNWFKIAYFAKTRVFDHNIIEVPCTINLLSIARKINIKSELTL